MDDKDPFDQLLGLEDEYYQQGYELGKSDGTTAGLVEGRLFGFEKGFDKFFAMSKIHGKAMVWASRLAQKSDSPEKSAGARSWPLASTATDDAQSSREAPLRTVLPPLPGNPRLGKHIRVMQALAEPESLSTRNGEEAVSEFDDRFRRAVAKARIVEKIVGEHADLVGADLSLGSEEGSLLPRTGEDNIENTNILQARH
jgi:hypothetical protein